MISLSTGLRNAVAVYSGFASMLNGGRICIYGGQRPLSADDVAGSEPLAYVVQDGNLDWMGDGGLLLAPGAATGTIVKSGTWIVVGDASGTPTWWRFLGYPMDDGAAVGAGAIFPRIDGSVGEGLDLSGIGDITPATFHEVQQFLLTVPANN